MRRHHSLRLAILRRGLLGALVLPVALAGCNEPFNPSDRPFNPAFERELETTVTAVFEELEVPGALVGLWIPSRGSWTTSLGVGNLQTGEPFRFDDHVRIGSVTKTFTVTLILQLADEGRLSLSDPVSKYFDTDPTSGKVTLAHAIPRADQITLRHLANMTSGLDNYTYDPDFQHRAFSNPHQTWDPIELANLGIAGTAAGCPNTLAEGQAACYEPGTDWNYSNTNTVLLGLVVQQVTGRSYGQVLRERIFVPLELDNTYHPTDAALPAPYAHGYTQQGLESGIQEATHWNPSWGFAAGALISDFQDMRTWARALGRGTLLRPETQAIRMTEVTVGPNLPGVRAYALGIGNTRGWWGHTGELPGYNSLAYYNPRLDAVLVVLANRDDEGPAPRIANAIIDLIEQQGW